MTRWCRRYGRSVALVVVGSALIALACIWYGVVEGWPRIPLPTSTPATRLGSAVGVAVLAFGVWLLVRTIRRGSRRRQGKRPRAVGAGEARDGAAVPTHGGVGAAATPSRTRLEGADGYQTAGSTWPPGWGRPEDFTTPLPAFPGGGLWAGLEVVPPDLPGRPTQEFPPLRTRGAQRRRVAAGSARGSWAATLPGGGVEAVARPQTPGDGPGTAVRAQTTWARPAAVTTGR